MFSALMHFFWLPYPKGIIISLGNTGFVSDAVTSLIYCIFITVYLVSVYRILSRTIDYDSKHTVKIRFFTDRGTRGGSAS